MLNYHMKFERLYIKLKFSLRIEKGEENDKQNRQK